ncbi:MAG: hypothetical protein ISN26_05450 [Betaproteobacteria bacterium AqS2]|uniref:RNA polymerase sigma-54 factor n=1 Tax=Candidatus Amphirhobacter heronislandensis TaxID=1732024 RepID=A0A930Y327_9GAMM|nr:hypothetical protein [Betaproteobacteria bacterium AqS2]
MRTGAPRPELAQRLGGTQMPRLASRLLGLGRQELLRELRQRAEANPLLELAEPDSGAEQGGWAPAAPGPSLGEHLAGQLETTPLPPRLRADALRCLVLLDDRGFLPAPSTFFRGR